MHDYTAFFCEENIWRLVDRMESVDSCFVLVFFNAFGTVALCQQKAFGETGVGIWDYHVVLLDAGQGQIHDFDTTLGFASPAALYLQQTFPDQGQLLLQYRTLVRAIPAGEYLMRFSSDRSHMLDENGGALASFPPWPAIMAAKPITLQQYASDRDIPESASVVCAIDRFDPDRPA